MPNGVSTSSTTLPSFLILETARYRVGEAVDHRAGLGTAMVCAASISFPDAIVSGDSVLPASCPARSYNVVSTVTPADLADSFTTFVLMETVADSSETFGVVTKTPQCATCVGSVTTTRTCW